MCHTPMPSPPMLPIFDTQTETHSVLEIDVASCHPDQCFTNARILTTSDTAGSYPTCLEDLY